MASCMTLAEMDIEAHAQSTAQSARRSSNFDDLSSSGKRSSLHPSARALAVGEISTLPDFDNVTIRIADVASNLAVLGYWLGDEVCSSTLP
jgi:hypothetical protein